MLEEFEGEVIEVPKPVPKGPLYKEIKCPSGLIVRIWNLKKVRDCIPQGLIVCDRRTAFGNRFIMGRDGNRADVCRKFRNWIYKQPKLMQHIRLTLGGKTDLGCHCAPLQCHVETIAMVANPSIAADIKQVNK